MNALSIRGLTKTYANGFTALHGIDLDVKQGDFFALLGPNGAGKSTTIGILCSLVNKTAGKIEVFGHDMERELDTAKSYLGVVPQEVNLNGFEKLFQVLVNQAGYYGLGRQRARERAEICLRELGLWDRRDDITRNLSGGMKRRLMIARALVHEPRLLILDEPTAGVDIEIRRSMWAYLQEINAAGTTIILTTHYLEEAEHLCRNIAIIDDGRIIEHSSMRQLLRRMDMEVVVLTLGESLEEAPDLPGHAPRLLDDHTLEVELHRGQSLNELFAALSARKVSVVSMRNRNNRLEQLFLRLVNTGDNAMAGHGNTAPGKAPVAAAGGHR